MRIGREHRDARAGCDAKRAQCAGELERAVEEFGVAVATLAVDHRHAVGEHRGRAPQEAVGVSGSNDIVVCIGILRRGSAGSASVAFRQRNALDVIGTADDLLGHLDLGLDAGQAQHDDALRLRRAGAVHGFHHARHTGHVFDIAAHADAFHHVVIGIGRMVFLHVRADLGILKRLLIGHGGEKPARQIVRQAADLVDIARDVLLDRVGHHRIEHV